MKKKLIFPVAILSTVFAVNYPVWSNETHHNSQQHHQQLENTSSSEHHHQTIMIPEGQPVPQVNLIVHPDKIKGWNLEIQLANFTFTPEHLNQDTQPNEGHAHLYLNGEKITRIYSNWYYLPQLPPGDNEITIQLNTNLHESLMYQDQIIGDTQIITVPN